jgi:hypothetical protein
MTIHVDDPVSVPRFHIDNGTCTDIIYAETGDIYYGVTGKTAGGFAEYNNMHFHESEVKALYDPEMAKLALKEYRSLIRCNPEKDMPEIKRAIKRMEHVVKTGVPGR